MHRWEVSVRIYLLFYLFFHRRPIQHLCVSTLTRPVENVVLTTKGIQERNTQLLDGMTVEK